MFVSKAGYLQVEKIMMVGLAINTLEYLLGIEEKICHNPMSKIPWIWKIFRQTISASGYINRGFTVKVNRQEQKVIIDFDHSQIDTNVHP